MRVTVKASYPGRGMTIGRNGFWNFHGIMAEETSDGQTIIAGLTKTGREIRQSGFICQTEDVDHLCVEWLKQRGWKVKK